MDSAGLLADFADRLPQTLIALDFDGTLAPIVADPLASRPVEGTVAALTALAGQGAHLAIITGRDALTVLELGQFADVPGLIVFGIYGAERWHDGRLETPDTPERIERLRAELPEVLRDAAEGVWIEDKRLSLVVHGRMAADPEAALAPLQQPVAELGERLGFELHPGRGVIELRLPGYDKGAALQTLIEQSGASSVLFAGDDVGDLPAFALIDQLRAEGSVAWSIAVSSPDVPEVVKAANVVVDEPAEVVALLNALAGRRPAAP